MKLLLSCLQPEDIVQLDYQGRSLFHETASRGQTKLFEFLLPSSKERIFGSSLFAQDVFNIDNYYSNLKAFAEDLSRVSTKVLTLKVMELWLTDSRLPTLFSAMPTPPREPPPRRILRVNLNTNRYRI